MVLAPTRPYPLLQEIVATSEKGMFPSLSVSEYDTAPFTGTAIGEHVIAERERKEQIV